ncbi:AMP-binding protein [Streptomyces sp. NPDC047081]|uniref:phenylacetate--CoA ligase family protein n=1 Tax=Streptomyces sp. NPDC047081 TaxID=3154706 RepID=UPI0033D8255A
MSDDAWYWESTAWDELLPHRQQLFEQQWEHLWRDSAYHQKAFAHAGLRRDSCPSLQDLSDVPFTWKEDMRASIDSSPPLGAHLAVKRAMVRQIQTSSGTTGRPLAIALTHADAAGFTEVLRRGYAAGGMTDSDTVLHGFSMSRGWIGGLCMVEGYLALGATVMPVGAEAGRDKLLESMQEFRPTAMCATPGFMLSLAERAVERGMEPADLGLEKVLVGGEPGGGDPAFRARLTEAWGGAMVTEMMGGTDVMPIVWGECEVGAGMHYLAADHVWFEIVDPASGKVLPFEVGAKGEIVYTHLRREASPVVRFRHRDIVEVVGWGDCSCGRKTPRIRCVGRADDMLIVRGVNLFPSAVRAVLAEVAGVGPEFRIVCPAGVYTLPGPLRVRTEARDGAPPRAELEAFLHQRLSVAIDLEYMPVGTLEEAGRHKSGYFDYV